MGRPHLALQATPLRRNDHYWTSEVVALRLDLAGDSLAAQSVQWDGEAHAPLRGLACLT
jgi:hypothetical protein